MRLLGRGVYRCTLCGAVVKTAKSDTLPVVDVIGDDIGTEQRVTVRDVEVHRCRVSDYTPMDIVGSGSRDWIDRALCGRSAHLEQWFPQEGESPAFAKATCSVCPVNDQCLNFAIDNHILVGIWGGQTAKERRRTARRRTSAA
jgi:WhiB family redox-sensing transcriptional regulator